MWLKANDLKQMDLFSCQIHNNDECEAIAG